MEVVLDLFHRQWSGIGTTSVALFVYEKQSARGATAKHGEPRMNALSAGCAGHQLLLRRILKRTNVCPRRKRTCGPQRRKSGYSDVGLADISPQLCY